jgi:rare lipoprotein A (peptidoglycan hydrolase)
VLVTSETTGRAVLVWVVDFCECRGGDERPKNDRLIDLAPDVWHALGIPLHRGVTRVTVELLDTR